MYMEKRSDVIDRDDKDISVYMYMEKWSDVIDREIKDISVHVYGETERGYI